MNAHNRRFSAIAAERQREGSAAVEERRARNAEKIEQRTAKLRQLNFSEGCSVMVRTESGIISTKFIEVDRETARV